MHSFRGFARPNRFLALSLVDRYSSFLLVGVLGFAAVIRLLIISGTDGGSDILGSDIPKSLMFLAGHDPYSVAPWESPYPPFLLLVDGLVLRLGGFLVPGSSLFQLSQDLRLAGLLGDLIVGFVIFRVLRLRGLSGFVALVLSSLFVLLPSTGWTSYYFFQSDRLGYPILAFALLGFVLGRLLVGSSLLALSVVFKVHPFLALLLVLVWLVRKYGLLRALPSIGSSLSVLFLGFFLPFWIPGYSQVLLGYNMSNGYETGVNNFSILNLFYGFLPSFLNVHLSLLLLNEIWIGSTMMLFSVALGIVWSRARSLDATSVVLLGLFAWLLPLRKLYTSYVTWAMIPFLMRTTNLAFTLVGVGLLEAANLLGYYCYFPPVYLPMNGVVGFFVASLVYACFNMFGLFRVLRNGSWR